MFSPAGGPEPEYVAPKITDYGDLAELTAGLSNGGRTDALFPINPRRDWTFSIP
jgi:hypothetical protein